MIEKILLIDDSPVARKILKSCLPTDARYEFFEAADGREGVDIFVKARPDVTFLDITMPVMDGFQCLEAIKNVDRNAVVIICTADAQPVSVARVMGLGALMVLRKPPSKETVQDALRKAVEVLSAGKTDI